MTLMDLLQALLYLTLLICVISPFLQNEVARLSHRWAEELTQKFRAVLLSIEVLLCYH